MNPHRTGSYLDASVPSDRQPCQFLALSPSNMNARTCPQPRLQKDKVWRACHLLPYKQHVPGTNLQKFAVADTPNRETWKKELYHMLALAKMSEPVSPSFTFQNI